ncbi:FtsX-like permease family protein [Dyadobacter flavalbus]|uniref:FtsX-like permease family protein n=1 Tax=Dyadobacter flavalbus TaxID=2579942 RepID=A0A5M8Q3J8_9BACT|nr:ABC transporter permease [Dyadobacter flavalbus]KAA6430465.1 FtsX-like permease family protein [Dyadobacter flavalbus]
MLKNYFKIAWRNILKRKFYSFVTIFGLSVGMTFSFLIMSYIWGELKVNRDLRNTENQYIIRSKWKNPDMGIDIATLGPLGKTLKEEYPDLVANYYRYDAITVAVSKGDKHFREDVQTGDSTLLSMYGFPLVDGNAGAALSKPNSIVITEDKALKYFGKTNAVGETLTLHNFVGGKQEYEVSAVLKTLSNNSVSHLLQNQAELFIPLSSLEGRKGSENNWQNPFIITYVELRDGVTKEKLKKPVAQILATHAPENIKTDLQVYLTSLTDYYREANDGLVRKMILTLSGVTAFIMLMAIVNFVNISIGKSSSRLKEIGVRKVLGSLKRQLVGQFLAESILLAFCSVILSVACYEAFRTLFGNLLGKPLDSLIHLFPYSIFIPVASALLVGSLAGIYPAFVLSGVPSLDSMKGKLKSMKENMLFRRLLVASQFVTALFVFACAAVVSQQVNFFFSKDLGYNKESLVSLAVPRDWTPEGLARMESVRNEFSRLKEVKQVSLSYEIPNGNNGGHYGIYKIGQDSTEAIHTQFLATDEKYADTYSLKMVSGKYFQSGQGESFYTDKIIINEAVLKALGYKSAEEAVGRQIRVHYFPRPLSIEGVIHNFHFESMHKAIKPLAIIHVRESGAYRYLTFRLNPSDLSESMAAIEQKWRELMPDAPFEYTFMDDTLQKLYQSEVQLKKASQLATILSVVIVLLGVLGMVSLNVARRTREVGIRKVLGASGISIILLFLREFLLVLLFAAAVSFPLVYITMSKWLQNYAYRIEIGFSTFAWAGLFFGTIISIIVCMQTYKAALMNPVKSLKTD